jgi:flagellar basal-body rod protein FlgB
MFIDRLLNQGPNPVLEQQLRFTEARQQLIADNIANVSTPNYRQKDLSVERFQKMLRERVDRQQSAPSGSVKFDDVSSDVEHPRAGILFHDGNNRSMEQLMTDNAKNALMHNLVVELLRRQYQTMDMALKERVS